MLFRSPGSQEIAANALSRALGITGIYNTEVNKLDDLVLVQQRVGDYIPLGSELYTVSRYTNYDFTPSYLDTLVNPEDLLRLAILDGTIQNGDRHGGNLLIANDPYYSKKFHLLPIDHSLSNLGPSNSSNFIDVGYTVVYQDIFNAFAKKIGNDNMKKLFEKIKGDFLSNFDKELSLLTPNQKNAIESQWGSIENYSKTIKARVTRLTDPQDPEYLQRNFL